MAHDLLLGVAVIARHGDALTFFQDPQTYAPKSTLLTPLGGMQEFELGSFLRSTYLEGGPNTIQGISGELVLTDQILARSRKGPEGNVILDSAVGLLQGLFPPTSANSINLANGSTIVGPLDGYQNIPIASVYPNEDITLQSWTSCPAFESHIAQFYGSSAFKEKAKEAADFLQELEPYLYGRSSNFKNMWNVFDFVNTQLTHNKTYAYHLPPTFIEQARALVDFHENGVFGGDGIGAIGNIAARTILAPTINYLERLADKKDPLRFVLQETDYQPIISLFHMLSIVNEFPELGALPNHASAFAIEVREGKDSREYLRFKFKNGTADDDFNVVHVFDHHADIPLTEFIYRVENVVIGDKKHWNLACSGKLTEVANGKWGDEHATFGLPSTGNIGLDFSFGGMIVFVFLFGIFALFKSVKRSRAKKAARAYEQQVEYARIPSSPVSEKIRFI